MSVRMSAMRTGFWLLTAVMLPGCNDFSGPFECTAIALPGIELTAEDAETGEPVADALAVAVEESFADSARTVLVEGDAVTALAHERPGTYEVSVEKEGFATWVRSGVVVGEDVCHVKSAELAAQLVPVSG